ncbi:MAG: MFS transporter, partial [Candidatus Dormibacteraeota bacterium]|nr:MFS transporter [Candidatus Dormibacteraeota bacterium]
MFRSLRSRNYRLYVSGQILSNTGAWVQRIAQDWLVLQLTHNNGAALGITTGLQFLPILLFGLWGGSLGDRFPKRRVLVVTAALSGTLAAVLGILTVTGMVRIWEVFALAFALGTVVVVDNPTRQTFVMEMVGRKLLTNAVSLNSACFNLARIAG